ncbi:DUF47 family protein [Halorussus pelagicus]|uniref:DUF47 family protein n=1 Tax=Halorussus pelagicus TaxID=2505977 RepID=UPI0014093212|nr:DUF47 family protein [Halorussus pelagicus]
MSSARGDYAAAVRRLTETYLDGVTDTTAHLPDALDAYGTDPAAFEEAVERVAEHESACDTALRELRGTVRESMPPNYTEMYLRVDDVARLYAAIDAVPNRAEGFVRELHAITPELGDSARTTLREMAMLTAEAAAELAAATTAYVEQLVGESAAVSVTDAVDRVADLESECDGLKHDALAAAFEGRPTAEALVVRELILKLDAAMDAVEDAAEHLLFVASADV